MQQNLLSHISNAEAPIFEKHVSYCLKGADFEIGRKHHHDATWIIRECPWVILVSIFNSGKNYGKTLQSNGFCKVLRQLHINFQTDS